MIPEAQHWAAVYADGVRRTNDGRAAYGVSTILRSPLVKLLEARDEALDNLNYTAWAIDNLAPGPSGELLIYVAGPYTVRGDDGEPCELGVDNGVVRRQQIQHIRRAADAGAELLRRGHYPLVPHTMTAMWDHDYPDIPWERYLDLCLRWLVFCHAILLLPGWKRSRGALKELARAKELGLHIFERVEDVPDLREED